MQRKIRKLSEQNSNLKQDLIETKVKYADSEGQKEKLEITMNSMNNKMQRLSLGSSQRSSQMSRGSQNESHENTQADYSVKSITSYLPGINFWSRRKE